MKFHRMKILNLILSFLILKIQQCFTFLGCIKDRYIYIYIYKLVALCMYIPQTKMHFLNLTYPEQ